MLSFVKSLLYTINESPQHRVKYFIVQAKKKLGFWKKSPWKTRNIGEKITFPSTFLSSGDYFWIREIGRKLQ